MTLLFYYINYIEIGLADAIRATILPSQSDKRKGGKNLKKFKNPEIQEKTNLEKDFELVVLK